MEDYYYYEDDYGDEEGESQDSALGDAYSTAKSLMGTNPLQCVAGLLAVERDDSSGGKWTFKSLKALVKVSRQMGAYEDMLRYYERVCTFNHKDVDKGSLQKAMTKFIDESQRVPVDYLCRALRTTAEVTSRDFKAYSRLWFNAKVKYATLLLDANDVGSVISEIEPVLAWCKEEDPLGFKKGSQLFFCYALLLQAYTVGRDWKKVRDMFFSTISIVNTIAPSRVVGSVLECGGKMYVCYRDWQSAFQTFSAAFRYYNEGGDPRRINCLKYLVLTCLLSGSDVDLFAAPETREYEEVAEIVPFSGLVKAYRRNDVQRFLSTADLVRQCFTAEPAVLVCLDLLLDNLRLRALVAFAAPYERLSMQRLQSVLLVDKDEVDRLCLRAVSEGVLRAKLDNENGVVIMNRESEVGPETERLLAFDRWVNALHEFNKRSYKDIERNL